MAQISGAGTPVDIKLGQSPTIKIPSLNYELQGIYNALHILSQYMEALRAGFEGSDTQTPSENIRFLKFITGTAGQKITAGHIVSFDDVTGLVVKGTNYGIMYVRQLNLNGINYAYVSGMIQTFFGVAQADAEIGEKITMGVGPAILKVTGAISGQTVYAMANKGVTYNIPLSHPSQVTVRGYELSEMGDVYLDNPEAQRIPGYPRDVSSTLRILGHVMASPIGIAVANDYVLFSDFQYWTGRVATNVAQLYP